MPPSKERNTSYAARRDDNRAHPLRKPASSDDFFTDSLLDSSRIPTPSPSKKNTNNALASKPRRAIGNTRTLRDAWDATASSGRRSSAGSDLYSRRDIFKSTPAQTTGRSAANPSKAQTTSSPPRGRQTSLPTASPTSDASSPPRGLNDVYQRIADEERLAAQEGEIEEIEEDDFTDSTMSHNDYGNEDRARLSRIRSSQSPLSFRGSTRNTPQPQAADADKENQREETGLTDASGMSFLENMTDQVLAAKLTPHTQDRARDRARLDKAVQKTTPLAFSKAQVGSRHALTAENLQRSAARDNSASVHGSSNGSMRNEDANPPPNVPRTWGTKGRVDKDWLRKIHDRNGNPAHAIPIGDKQPSSQIDWTAAAADVPLPSVEDSLTPRPEQPRDSTQTSLSHQSSLDRIRQWELNDFTGTNLLVSDSPPVKVRSSVPDQIKDREIETLEKRAVTTNRLGEIRKKNSRELLVGKARSQNVEAQKGVDDDASPEKEAMTKFEEVGEPIPDTPIVVFKASANGIKQNQNANGRPIQYRKDSRDSLQRLARAISESPKPSLTPEDWSFIKKEEAESAQPEMRKLQMMQHESRKSSREVADATSPSSVKRSISADAARTPIVTGAWTDTILPNTIKTVKHKQAPTKYAQTPHVTGGWIDTPVVAGTRQSSSLIPVPADKIPKGPDADPEKDNSKPTTNKDADTKPATKLAPNLPRSALTSLLTKAKRKLATGDQQDSASNQEEEINNNDTLNLGDATIESLEDLLTLDNADMTTLLRMGAEFEARREMDSNTYHPSRDRGADREPDAGSDKAAGTETELLERLGTKLERLRTNIHDARKGISKLEHQVSQPSPQTSTGNAVVKSANGELLTGPCQSCGCPRGTSSLFTTSNTKSTSDIFLPVRLHIPQQITLPVPRLWYSAQKHEPWWRPPRPTILGYATLALWLWYLSETALCHWGGYCHPEYAEYYVWPDLRTGGYDGYGYGINGRGEMRWGRITWTLVRSWILGGLAGSWMGSLWWLVRGSVWLVVRWVSMLAGWSDGFASEAVGAASAAASASGTGAVGLGTDGPVVGMGEDEFL